MNKISPNRQKKEQIVARLAEKVGEAKGLVFTNYQGLTHKQLEDLKKKVKAAKAELVVTKNTLLKLALLNSKLETRYRTVPGEARNSKHPSSDGQNSNDKNLKHLTVSDFDIRISDFQGPTATLFLYGDPSEPFKQLARSIKEFNLPSIKFGILDKQTITSDQILRWAALPSREILISQLVMQIKSPIYGLHRALSWNMQKLVAILKAIELKNPS